MDYDQDGLPTDGDEIEEEDSPFDLGNRKFERKLNYVCNFL
jgi:hypothetical protein